MRISQLSVSVVITTYNRAHLVCRAIESALSAVLPGDEVIVVDDGSTDNTAEVLERYKGRIRFLPVVHGGPGASRNHGIRAAKNPLIAHLDSDDEWMADKLLLQRKLFESRPDIVLCCSDFVSASHTGEVNHSHLSTWHNDPRSWNKILAPGISYSSVAPLPPGRGDFKVHIGDLYLPMVKALYVATSTAMVRKDLAGDAYRFPEDLRTLEEWECFGRVAGKGPTAYFACETMTHHEHDGPQLVKLGAKIWAENQFVILERVWGSDREFELKHRRILDEVRCGRLKEMLSEGRRKDALAEIRSLKRCPLSYRLLAMFPGGVTRWLLSLRRGVRKLLTGE